MKLKHVQKCSIDAELQIQFFLHRPRTSNAAQNLRHLRAYNLIDKLRWI